MRATVAAIIVGILLGTRLLGNGEQMPCFRLRSGDVGFCTATIRDLQPHVSGERRPNGGFIGVPLYGPDDSLFDGPPYLPYTPDTSVATPASTAYPALPATYPQNGNGACGAGWRHPAGHRHLLPSLAERPLSDRRITELSQNRLWTSMTGALPINDCAPRSGRT